jgi:anti-sigma factor RsiW
MTACRDIERELVAFSSGELESAQRASVREHLDRCASCRAELAREWDLRRTLGSLPAIPAPDDFDGRILAAVHAVGRNSFVRRNRVRLTAAATLIAASVVLALMLPTFRPASDADPAWTQEEIATARHEVVFTLALTAQVINHSQREAVVEVFADRLPNAINESLQKVKLTTSGGNG